MLLAPRSALPDVLDPIRRAVERHLLSFAAATTLPDGYALLVTPQAGADL